MTSSYPSYESLGLWASSQSPHETRAATLFARDTQKSLRRHRSRLGNKPSHPAGILLRQHGPDRSRARRQSKEATAPTQIDERYSLNCDSGMDNQDNR